MNKAVPIGFLLIFAGMALVVFGSVGRADLSTGGFILIGPFPIVFGTGREGGQLALLSLISGLVIVLSLLFMAWRISSARHQEGRNP